MTDYGIHGWFWRTPEHGVIGSKIAEQPQRFATSCRKGSVERLAAKGSVEQARARKH